MPLVRERVLCRALAGGGVGWGRIEDWGVFCMVGLFFSWSDLEAGVQVVGLLLALLFCALLCPFLER